MKAIISGIVLLGLYAGGLVLKDYQIQEAKRAYVPTTYDLQKKHGIPVYTDKVVRGKFQEYLTLSGALGINGSLVSSVAPSIKRQIRLGQLAYLELPDSQKKIQGRVSSISAAPSLLTGLYEVIVHFDHRFSSRLGSVTVDIPIREVRDVVLVPRTGITKRSGSAEAFTLLGKTIQKKKVEIAGANADEYWIKSGLGPNETIVTSDTRYFTGGETVQVVNETGDSL